AGARPVVCFTGDGGFYYHLAELESVRRRGIAVAVIVNNNSGFGQNLTGARRSLGEVLESPRGPNGPTGVARGESTIDDLVRFGPTDFAAVAKSFGVKGLRVERADGIAPALAEAIGAGESVVVDVVTDIEPRAPEPWSPG
ncbi:MAG: thiamine pyrophosphate-dependent enzyme, partial [Acetobacteraceae bacterium]